MKRKIKLEAIKNPCVLANVVESTTRVCVSTTTIKNVLNSEGIYSRVPRKKPYISETNRKGSYLLGITSTSPSVFGKMYYSLMRVNLICLDLTAERRYGEGKVKNSGTKTSQLLQNMEVGVLIVLAYNGVGNLVPIEGILNAEGYVKILLHNLLASAAKLGI
ncbi:uncharacterized protein [Halyomorpha halys]|uniref:uncharacterized protein n=1 Tax=Halyomorpha halys TaxID=286706 RepID=UPI0034D2B32E